MPSELVGEGGWPFWWGALGLTSVSLAFLFATRGFLGVSGSYRRLLEWRSERAREKTEALVREQDLEALMMAETLAAFGPEAVAAMEANAEKAKASTPSASIDRAPTVAPRLPTSAHAVFLASLMLGGALGAWSRGTFSLESQMGDLAARFGAAWPLALVAGGVLVGFGTTLSGGCTSGHGLSGASRFQPGSLVATGIFFSTGVLVAHLLGAWS